MPKILAVTEEMERRAAAIGSNADALLDVQNAVTNIFQNMGRDFSGRIPSLMTEKMIAMEETYQGINAKLNEYKDFLSEVAKNYEWNDSEATRWFQSLE
ncbi:MAG: hypothetical protein IJP54_09275 [Synergistaceae bacterium]|nr:hypothetical protein [Synergistaceae bacterium]